MEEVQKKEANAEMTKEVTVAASRSLVSDTSYDTALPKLTSVQGRTTGPTRRSTKGGWTENEDDILTRAVKIFNGKNWKKIAEFFPGRSDVQCLHRWQKVLNPDLIKGPWTKEEDDRIIELVEKYGCKKWSVIAKSLPGRIGKQCRERWHNHLNPAIKKDAWTKEEELALIRAHQIYGNKWAEIARFLPGRADNSIKNHWNCSVKKKLDSYSTSGFAGDLPGINALDLNNHDTKAEFLKAEVARQILGTIVSLDQKMDSEGGVDTFSGGPIPGNTNEGEKDLQSLHVLIEKSRSLKKKVDEVTKAPIGIQCDGKNATATSLISERHEGDANHAKTPDDLHPTIVIQQVSCGNSLGEPMKFLPSQKCTHEPTDHINLSPPIPPSGHLTLTASSLSAPLDVTVCGRNNYTLELVCAVTAKRLLESPKRPRHSASPTNGSGGADSIFNRESNNPFSSFSACDFGSDNGQVCRQNKVPGTPLQCEDINFGRLCYEPPQMKNVLENGTFSSANILYSRPTNNSVCCSTPPSHVQSISVNGSSPESILRSAAKSFKNTPSIIRKRGRESSRQAANANDSDGICTPELRTGSSNATEGSTYSCPHVCTVKDDLNSTDLLTVKWLSLSSPNSPKPVTAVAVKSVEKRLEYMFDMEWDSAKAKRSTSTTASDSSDANHCANTW